jgi:hypothetical protein
VNDGARVRRACLRGHAQGVSLTAPTETAHQTRPDSWDSPGSSVSRQNKGPAPFGVKPAASDFAMRPLLVHNLSIMRCSFSITSFLSIFTLRHPPAACIRGIALVGISVHKIRIAMERMSVDGQDVSQDWQILFPPRF